MTKPPQGKKGPPPTSRGKPSYKTTGAKKGPPPTSGSKPSYKTTGAKKGTGPESKGKPIKKGPVMSKGKGVKPQPHSRATARKAESHNKGKPDSKYSKPT